MTKQRYNVSDIAEILIEEIEAFKKSAESIKLSTDKLQQTKVEISKESIELLVRVLEVNQEKQKAFSILLEKIISKSNTRLPNWVIAVVFGFFLAFIGFSFFTYKKVEKVKLLESHNEYLEIELLKTLRN
ncbi:MAG: DUF6730 family protein [Salinivirgaceae bacterium]|jgi:hypothetical protein